jgi:hypothetical protein
MKLYKSAYKKIFGKWVTVGWNLERFSLEFSIDKYALNISLGFIWFGVEF